MHVLGISAFYHESACCLLSDGLLVAAAAEERFTRVKHDPRLPVEAFRFCLARGGLTVADLDAVAYYELPAKKLARQLWAGVPEDGAGGLAWLDPRRPEQAIRERLGWEGPVLTFPHHTSHAASAYYYSGFPDAAVLTVDGVGEWDTTTYGRAAGDDVELFDRVEFPHSLGLLYSTVTSYLGFRVNGGEYKVMGLAPYGGPRLVDQVRQLVHSSPGGGYALDLRYFDFLRGRRMYSQALVDLLGEPPRAPESPILPFHQDLARSVQAVLEEILLEKVAYLYSRVPSERLVMAGGVALNAVANGRIRREGPFREAWIQPAAGDAGGALGAAALAHRRLAGSRPGISPTGRMEHAFHGPRFVDSAGAELERFVRATGLAFEDFRDEDGGDGDEGSRALVEAVAERLAAGQVIGWFSGAMELGPRALGGRSILASPLVPDMRDRINWAVKKREGFRPFAPAVLAEHAAHHFDLDHPAPFMLETCRVTSSLALPAITHVDGSARPQTVDRALQPRFAGLLDAFFRRTGCPMLLNTSFNVRGEPIVATPADALLCMASSEIDCLVLERFLLDRDRLPEHLPELADLWRHPRERSSAVSERLYTFV